MFSPQSAADVYVTVFSPNQVVARAAGEAAGDSVGERHIWGSAADKVILQLRASR